MSLRRPFPGLVKTSHRSSTMASFDVSAVLVDHLKGLDEDVVSYLTSVVDAMSSDERKASHALYEAIGPFLLDCGSVDSEEAAEALCKTISVSFGGSGFKSAVVEVEEQITLLSAPIKMSDRSGLNKAPKATYGGAVISNMDEDGQVTEVNHNANLDAAAIPTTQRQIRKNRKENERLQRILRAEEMARMKAEAEMAAARMAAIKANRSAGRQAAMGVNIERFSIPHPSGTSDLITDASLTLASGRRYGLVGKNGAGIVYVRTVVLRLKFTSSHFPTRQVNADADAGQLQAGRTHTPAHPARGPARGGGRRVPAAVGAARGRGAYGPVGGRAAAPRLPAREHGGNRAAEGSTGTLHGVFALLLVGGCYLMQSKSFSQY
jgi:hypothetical protein